MASYGVWQGAERATGTMAATGMRLLEMRGTEQHRRALEADSARRLTMAEDQAKIQNAQQNLALEESIKKKAAYEKPLNINIHPYYLSMSDEGKKNWTEYLLANGAIDKDGVGQVGAIMDALGTVEKSKELFPKLMGSEVTAKQNAATAAWGQYQEAQASGDPKKAQTAKALFDQAYAAADTSLTAFKSHMDALIKADQAEELERIKQGGKGATRADEWKISELMAQNPGLSSQEATGIILGTIKVLQDPVSGTRNIVDTVAGTERPLVEAGGIPSVGKKPAPTTKSIWELSSKSTGPISAAKAAGSVVTGTIGLPVAENTLYARQFVQGAQNDLIRSLSINPRFPVGEINRLKEEVNLAPTIFDNPKMMRQRILAINDYLSKRVKNEMDAAKDTSLGVEARKNARSAANDIANFLDILGAPSMVTTKEEYDALPKGAIYITEDGTEKKKGGK